MSQTTDNILYIPIQINGGSELTQNLLDRELFIDSKGILYVGTPEGNKIVAGNVIKNANIASPTITDALKFDTNIIMTKEQFDQNKAKYQDGRVLFVDEGTTFSNN